VPVEPSASERRIALVGIFLCMFLAALDQTIVATALPRVVQDLGGTTLYAWVATSYLLASTIALPVAGRLVDMVSPKHILIAAASVFLVGSALSGLSTSMDQLILFRAIQGLGGGAIFTVASSVIGLLYPPRERGRVQGLFGAVFGIASVVGPYLGGLLTDSFSWRFVFYVNMPFGIVALYVLLAHMPTLSPRRSQTFDYGGVATLLLWTVPMLLALSWAGSTYAWLSPQVLGLLALTAVGIALFYYVETHSRSPLFDLSLLKLPVFTWAGIATLFFGAAFLGSILFLPLYLVMARGISPEQSGLTLTPLTLGVVVGSFAAGQLASRMGRYKGLILGGTLLAAVMFAVLYTVLTTTIPIIDMLGLLVALGLGLGPSFPLYTLAVQNAVRRDQIGVASSGNMFMRQIGSAIGAAIMGAVLVSAIKTQMAAQLPASLRAASSGATSSFASENLESRAQMRSQIVGEFRTIGTEVVAALKGSDAAYAKLEHDSAVPASDKKLLVPGGLPAEIASQNKATLTLLTAAVHGQAAARARITADTRLPAALRALAQHPPAGATAQAAALARAKAALAAAAPAEVRAAEKSTVPTVQAKILAAGETVYGQIVRAVTVAVTAGVRNTFGLATLLTAVALVAGLFLPAAELRRPHHDGEAFTEAVGTGAGAP
jgi:EmrB/QacA subfamily drug resistance transporter